MPDHQTYRLYYDGNCPFCNEQVCNLHRQTKEIRLELININNPTAPVPQGVNQAALQREIHLLTPEGKILRNVDALLALAPFTAPGSLLQRLAPLLRLSLLRPFARLGYRLVACFRHRLRRTLPKEGSPDDEDRA
ncbi:MAG: hypothetical protein C0621_10330 [Desulfuromonas sp.]|nr:MAG: hypothetical protein C0621_10330 [Desulfuromonas sp.]